MIEFMSNTMGTNFIPGLRLRQLEYPMIKVEISWIDTVVRIPIRRYWLCHALATPS
jgi:hypothetical protein